LGGLKKVFRERRKGGEKDTEGKKFKKCR